MVSKTALPSAVLILRLLTLALLTASLAVIATDKLRVDGAEPGDPPQKVTFKDVHAYRFVLAVAIIGCAYTLLQLPFVAVAIARRKRLDGVVALLLTFADVAFGLLLAAGAAAGLGFTHDMKRIFDEFFGGSLLFERLLHDGDRFFNLAFVSAGLMLAAAVCTALIIMISVYSLVK